MSGLSGSLIIFLVSFFVSVDLSLVSFNWFLTVFVDNFPVQVCIQIGVNWHFFSPST